MGLFGINDLGNHDSQVQGHGLSSQTRNDAITRPDERNASLSLSAQDMMKHYKEETGRDVIARTLKSMTNVAWHINDMKRKHEASVHVQEIQSQLHGWQVRFPRNMSDVWVHPDAPPILMQN